MSSTAKMIDSSMSRNAHGRLPWKFEAGTSKYGRNNAAVTKLKTWVWMPLPSMSGRFARISKLQAVEGLTIYGSQDLAALRRDCL